MADQVVLAVDGGNVKTDLALVKADGTLLSLVRGGGSSPHFLGVDGCVGLLDDLLARAIARSEPRSADRPVATIAQILLAGADLPEDFATLRSRIERLTWSERLVVDNDTLALLRSGTDRGWGVAVVCGAGINCLGVAPDGREVRFLALGEISGDWGGGAHVGLAALVAAARSVDGRGPRTVLETAVPAHFGVDDPLEISLALHRREIPRARLGELARVVFAAAEDDPVAAGIVDRLADEVTAFAIAALRRLDLTAAGPDVVLGGGLLRAVSPGVIETVARGVREEAPGANVLLAPSDPIVGAALLGLDALGVGGDAAARARAELDTAVRALARDGGPEAGRHRAASAAAG